MAGERRTVWLGAALVVALVALVGVRSMDQSAGPVAGERRSPPPRPTGRNGAHANSDAAADVNLALLKRERGEPGDTERNPFRFRPKPAPPVATGPAVTRPSNQTAGAPFVPAVPTGPPPLPPIPLKFIGLVQKLDGTKIAVLSDGKHVMHGLEGQDHLLKVGQESIEISYIDGRGRQTIRLTGQ
jgi:hypothetical protein